MKIVIYNELGTFKTTTEDNYNATIRNANKVQAWINFASAEEIIDYCIKYCGKTKEDFIVSQRYFASDKYNTDRLTIKAFTVEEVANEFYNKYGYNPDIIKIIDDLGGVIETIKE